MPRLPAGGGTPGIHLCRGALRSGLQRTVWAGRAPTHAPPSDIFFKKLPQFLGRVRTSFNNFLLVPRKTPEDVYRQGIL